MKVVFALISSGPDSQTQMLPAEEFARPYSERDRFTVEADPDETLASLRGKAFRHFGFDVPDSTSKYGKAAMGPVAFFKEGDHERIKDRVMPRMHWGQLILVDDEGHAIFGVYDLRTVTLGDLLRASEAGVLDGDPLRPYLMVEGGWGDHPPPDWPTLVHGFEVAWPYIRSVIETTGIALTLQEVWKRVSDRLRTSAETADEHREWSQKHYSPYQFQALLRTRNWTTEQIAVLLDCPVEDVEPVMWGLGFSLDPETETWKEESDLTSDLVRKVHLEIDIVSNEDPKDDLDALLRDRIKHLIETGESAPVSHLEPAFPEDNPDFSGGFASRPRVGALLDRVGDLLDRVRY
jgi:hypothetical protein